MAFQALYRRYRPQRFGEVKGQEHVVAALRHAVRDQTVAHAYLFSGPRGTGKTSTARILAKALNCGDLDQGEPCGVCEPCRAVEAGTSMAVTELDAASNNGVEAVRDLIQRASLGTSGRTKVYIVDEVHMLSNAASNALLKTLEEPPGHVVFVLATTDPHRVLPTIRSRTQHFDFRLLPAPLLGDHLRQVAADAGLPVGDAAIDRAVRKGDGSARDALSALDQIVAAGGEGEDDASVDEIVEGLCDRDTARALGGVALACGAGIDPRSVASAVAAHLRDALLSLMAPDLVSLPDAARERVADQARRLGAAAVVRALDAVGSAVLLLPNAPDPRVTLEVALVKVARPDVDTSLAAVTERLERLERGSREVTTAIVDATSPLGSVGRPAPAPSTATPASAAGDRPPPGSAGAARARDALAAAGRPASAPAGTGPEDPGTATGPAADDAASDRLAGSEAGTTGAGPVEDRPAGARGVRPADASGGTPRRPDTEGPTARRTAAVPPASPAGSGPARPMPAKPALGAVRGTSLTPDRGARARPRPAVGGADASEVAGSSEPGGRRRAAEGAPAPPAPPAAGERTPGALPGIDELTSAWADVVVPRLSTVSKGRFSTGRFVDVAGGAAVLALPNSIMRGKCEERRPELERVLADHFGRPVPVRLVVDASVTPSVGAPSGPPPPEPDDHVDLDALVDAPDDHRSGIDRLTEAFPGAQVVDGA